MNSKNPDELGCSTAPETYAEQYVSDDGSATDVGDLSEVGLICQDILSAVCRVDGLSDLEKGALGQRVNVLLELFHEFRMTNRKAKTRIKALNSRVRNLSEQLAVLRKSQFGQSSEKDLMEKFGDDLGLADEDDEDEPGQTLLGKRVRKVGADVKVERVDHFPENRSCQSCGCEMQSIKKEERVGELRIVPEHASW